MPRGAASAPFSAFLSEKEAGCMKLPEQQRSSRTTSFKSILGNHGLVERMQKLRVRQRFNLRRGVEP